MNIIQINYIENNNLRIIHIQKYDLNTLFKVFNRIQLMICFYSNTIYDILLFEF